MGSNLQNAAGAVFVCLVTIALKSIREFPGAALGDLVLREFRCYYYFQLFKLTGRGLRELCES